MDDLLDWSQVSSDDPAAFQPFFDEPLSSSPHFLSSARQTSPAAGGTNAVGEEVDQSIMLEVGASQEIEEESDAAGEGAEDDGSEEGEEGTEELLGFDSEDELPELTFSTRSNSPTSSLEPTTPSAIEFGDDFALDFSQASEEVQVDDHDQHDLLTDARLPVHRSQRSPSFPPSFAFSPPPDRSPSPASLPSRLKGQPAGIFLPKRLPPLPPSPSCFDLPSPRAKSPSQAEMDAFFGFKPRLPLLQPVRIPSPSRRAPTPSPTPSPAPSLSRQASPLLDFDVDVDEKPSPSASASKQKKGKPAKEKKEEDKPALRAYYQLQPIPTVSPDTGNPLTADEKRFAPLFTLFFLPPSFC
jgi:hypothetical protein